MRHLQKIYRSDSEMDTRRCSFPACSIIEKLGDDVVTVRWPVRDDETTYVEAGQIPNCQECAILYDTALSEGKDPSIPEIVSKLVVSVDVPLLLKQRANVEAVAVLVEPDSKPIWVGNFR